VAGAEGWEMAEDRATCEGAEWQVGLSGTGRWVLGHTSPMALSRGSVRGKDFLFGMVVLVGVLIRKYRIRVRTRS
jgi:hypothetical protein